MKKATISTCLGLLLFAGATATAQQRATAFDVRPAVTVRMPLKSDSVDFMGSKFTPAELLKSDLTLDFDGRTHERVEADTAGVIRVKKAESDHLLYLFATDIRAGHFLKGKLQITSPARFEVFVDGVSKAKKERTDDSFDEAQPLTVDLRMEPEIDYRVVIKLLSSADDQAEAAFKCAFRKQEGFEEIDLRMDPGMKHRFKMVDITLGSRVSRVALSPDGKYLLTTYTDCYSEKDSRTHTELTETRSGRMLIADLDGRMRWMPRSNKLYRLRKGQQRNDLVLFDPATMREEVLMTDLPDGYFTWSPDESYLVFTVTEENKEPKSGPLNRIVDPDDRIPGSRSRSHLVKYDPASGLSERLTFGGNVYLQDISPDGKRLLCTNARTTMNEFPFYFSTLFELDPVTLQTDTIIAREAYVTGASYSPDGKRLLVTGSPSAFGGVGKNCDLPIANDYDVQAYIMDRATREVDPITRDFLPSVERAWWNRTDNDIYFSTTDRDCRHIYRYDVPTRGFELLPLAEDLIYTFSLPEDNPTLAAYVGGGYNSSGVAYLYDMKKQRSTLLADPMREKMDGIEMGKVEPWRFTASDGTEIDGVICLPPSFDPAKRYPLIVYYYGGTTPTSRGITSPYSAQVFAARDYVVYVIQPSGTIGYGQEFSARHVNAWGDWTADNIIEGVQKFCEAHPFVDPERIGCAGASYGGFMTQYLQTKTDLFAAAVSHAGISNVTSYWGEGFWGYSYNAVAAARSYPWTNPDLFTKHGSLFNADKIHTPLLLLHGTVDTNVPIGESIQLFNALKILGRDVAFVTVDGENHIITDYTKRKLWHDTIMAWFARYLQDRPEWWNDLYPERNW